MRRKRSLVSATPKKLGAICELSLTRSKLQTGRDAPTILNRKEELGDQEGTLGI